MSISNIVAAAKKAFRSGVTLPIAFRREQLLNLRKLLLDNEAAIADAVYEDLKKGRTESDLMETSFVMHEVKFLLDNLDSLSKPHRVSTGIANIADHCSTQYDPLGTVLIIGAYNYPIQLTLGPMAGAIAAGNTVVLKPSELSRKTEKLIVDLIPKYLNKDCYKVVTGAVAETTALLDERWDLIFYTGSTAVGKVVMKAASNHLTPVILELGGKSPVIIDRTCGDLAVAAQRIAWGRYLNSGQSCIAPDYVMVLDEQTKVELVKHLKAAVAKFFPKGSGDYGKMVNERHFDRVKSLIDEGKGKIEFGGQSDRASLTIEPTVVTDVPRNCKLMSEEIFGPVLAVFTVKSIDEAIAHINAGEKPLALYVFTGDKSLADRVITETSSGAVVVNDTMVHALVDTLPFGGVGHSGIGAYHGKHSYEAFSHKKAVVRKDLRLEIANELRYPPYSQTKLKWIKWILGFPHAPKPEGIWAHAKLIALVAILLGIIAYVA